MSEQTDDLREVQALLDDLLVLAAKVGNVGALGLALNVPGPVSRGYDALLAAVRRAVAKGKLTVLDEALGRGWDDMARYTREHGYDAPPMLITGALALRQQYEQEACGD